MKDLIKYIIVTAAVFIASAIISLIFGANFAHADEIDFTVLECKNDQSSKLALLSISTGAYLVSMAEMVNFKYGDASKFNQKSKRQAYRTLMSSGLLSITGGVLLIIQSNDSVPDWVYFDVTRGVEIGTKWRF